MDTVFQFPQNKTIKILAQVIGLIWLTTKSTKFLYSIYKIFLRSEKNLIKRYGQNSYALITGSSSGIGEEFCLQLAQRGFNIILLARDNDKLQKIKQNIQNKYRGRDVVIILYDFNDSFNDQQLQNNIFEQIKDLDISILINNAGIHLFEHFEKENVEYVKKMISVNCISTYLLTKLLIEKKFLQRAQKSAVINVSSACGVIPMAYYSTYCGTKSFVDTLTLSITKEFKNIDILCLRPFDVSTYHTNFRKPDLMTITPLQCVKGCLKDLGYESTTFGFSTHKFQYWAINLVPQFLFDWIYLNFIAKDFFKEQSDLMQKSQQSLNKKTN